MNRSRSPRRSSPPRRELSPSRCIYIAGFPHGVALPELEDALTAYGPVGRIDMKKGFAFVFMKRNSDADYLVQKLDGSRLLGARVRVEFARGAMATMRREEERRKAQQPTSTLFVVNFDEERTHEQDLKDFFRDYEVWSVSMKKNFAFVEFASVRMAQDALERLNGASLFDRPIVLEYKGRPGGGYGGPPPPRGRSPSPPPRRRSPSPPPRRRSPRRTPPREPEYRSSGRYTGSGTYSSYDAPYRGRRSRSRSYTPPLPKRRRGSRSRSYSPRR